MENVKENHKIDIKTDGKKIYEIHLEDSFENLMDSMEFLDLPGRKVCIVTESNVAPIYLQEIYKRISPKAAKVVTFSFTAGEANKQLATIEKIYEQLIRNHFDRKDLLVALGGGVVGDMTGFAAATYLRGIDFIQIPTTLLAQVDSSIGGKTGVDFLQYKNMVGAFHQPKLVYINTAALKSLPEREYFSGMGEVIKHGLIKDSGYYQWIKDHKKEIKDRDEQILREMIYRSCLIKGGVVERDPKEQGERALLNFGHTLGHAIEKLKEFQWLHGECVGVGCQLAAMISAGRGEISQDDVKDIKATFKEFDLWKPVGEIDPEEVVQTTKSDKKMEGNHVKFILLHQIGEAFIDRSVTEEEMRHALEQWN